MDIDLVTALGLARASHGMCIFGQDFRFGGIVGGEGGGQNEGKGKEREDKTHLEE